MCCIIQLLYNYTQKNLCVLFTARASKYTQAQISFGKNMSVYISQESKKNCRHRHKQTHANTHPSIISFSDCGIIDWKGQNLSFYIYKYLSCFFSFFSISLIFLDICFMSMFNYQFLRREKDFFFLQMTKAKLMFLSTAVV